ncbi:hypothetical protein PIB30_108594, partial [Stylosanthes scabra]|nr:hypothetical protein [Stylosanthes scabra]
HGLHIAVEETMKEKCSRYEKHLQEASLTLKSNLIKTRDRLNLVRNEAATAKENNDNLIVAKETMKEKCSRYEKHLEESSLTLESYSKDRKVLEKELTAIQAKIKDIDNKVARIRVPFEKTQSKKQELDANLARIAESKTC